VTVRRARSARGVPILLLVVLGLAVSALAPAPARAAEAPRDSTALDSLVRFHPPTDWSELGMPEAEVAAEEPDEWLRTPFGDRLLTDPEEWRSRRQGGVSRLEPLLDYNRVDPIRLGVLYQAQAPITLYPRLGARLEYATGRKRTLYGLQIEQPLAPSGRLAAGASMVRRTDHSELQQVEDAENALALLFGRQDYRDYFEREGFGAYLATRIPGVTTASLHLRNDQYRSLTTRDDVGSLFHRSRDLRPNPAVTEGESHTVVLRLERLAHRTRRTRAGTYHWIEFERAGSGLGGDFAYSRLLGDVRGVMRLSPATTLGLRLVAGSALAGTLPPQREFTCGGVDGLRAHAFSQYRGNQIALAVAEYTIGLWRLRASTFEGGLHAIAFLDAGRAWENAGHAWDLGDQKPALDGGFGLSTSEDNLRVYFAKDLRDPDRDFVISARLQRPF